MEELNLAGGRIATADDSDSDEGHEDECGDDASEADEEAEMMRARQEVLEDQNRQLELQLRALKALLVKRVTFPLLNIIKCIDRKVCRTVLPQVNDRF